MLRVQYEDDDGKETITEWGGWNSNKKDKMDGEVQSESEGEEAEEKKPAGLQHVE